MNDLIHEILKDTTIMKELCTQCDEQYLRMRNLHQLLKTTASQKKYDELTPDEQEDADWVFAYDTMVDNARTALRIIEGGSDV